MMNHSNLSFLIRIIFLTELKDIKVDAIAKKWIADGARSGTFAGDNSGFDANNSKSKVINRQLAQNKTTLLYK